MQGHTGVLHVRSMLVTLSSSCVVMIIFWWPILSYPISISHPISQFHQSLLRINIKPYSISQAVLYPFALVVSNCRIAGYTLAALWIWQVVYVCAVLCRAYLGLDVFHEVLPKRCNSEPLFIRCLVFGNFWNRYAHFFRPQWHRRAIWWTFFLRNCRFIFDLEESEY